MSKIPPEIILASGSKYRALLLERLHLKFKIIAPGLDETPDIEATPGECAESLSVRKAQHIGNRFPEALVIGSDQVAEFDERIIGKPGSMDVAINQLMSFSGRSVLFHSGVALVSVARGFAASAVETTRVHFRDLNRDEIERYVEIEQPLDCAGSFKCESLGISLFSAIECSDPTALVGMPLILLCSLLRRAGVELPLDA